MNLNLHSDWCINESLRGSLRLRNWNSIKIIISLRKCEIIAESRKVTREVVGNFLSGSGPLYISGYHNGMPAADAKIRNIQISSQSE